GKVMGFCLAVTGIKSSYVFWNGIDEAVPEQLDISWLNQVERFFGLLTDRRIRRGTFGSVRELETAIRDYRTHRNQNSKPFPCTADADSIRKKIAPFVCELLLGTLVYGQFRLAALRRALHQERQRDQQRERDAENPDYIHVRERGRLPLDEPINPRIGLVLGIRSAHPSLDQGLRHTVQHVAER